MSTDNFNAQREMPMTANKTPRLHSFSWVRLGCIGLACLGSITFPASAKDQGDKAEQVAPVVSVTADSSDNDNNGPILRLEDTIRGNNKEQPQVLTIVPWQLPVHKNIDESTHWQPVTNKLPAIDRNTLLRNLEISTSSQQ